MNHEFARFNSMEGTPQRCGEDLLVNSCFIAVLCDGKVCVVCIVVGSCRRLAWLGATQSCRRWSQGGHSVRI